MKTYIKAQDGRRLVKMDPDSARWEKAANELARTWVHIHFCGDCGGPVVEGYCCQRCGSSEP